MRKVIVKKRKEDFLREVRQAGKSFLIPGDVLMLTVYFDGVPTVYSTAVRSRGDLE